MSVVAWEALTDQLWPGARFRRSEPLVGGLGSLGGLRCLPTPASCSPAFHEQGRTDLTAEVVADRARRFIADALAEGAALRPR